MAEIVKVALVVARVERGARPVSAQPARGLRRGYGAHQLILREAEHGQLGERPGTQPRRRDGGGEKVVPLRLHCGESASTLLPQQESNWAAQPQTRLFPAHIRCRALAKQTTHNVTMDGSQATPHTHTGQTLLPTKCM